MEGFESRDAVVRARRFFILSPEINRILTFICYLYREVDVFPKLLPERERARNQNRWRTSSFQMSPEEVKSHPVPQKPEEGQESG